jgi:hypothetical protein
MLAKVRKKETLVSEIFETSSGDLIQIAMSIPAPI